MASTEQVPMGSTYMDYPEHERTYRNFITGAKYLTAALAVLMILMAIFLV